MPDFHMKNILNKHYISTSDDFHLFWTAKKHTAQAQAQYENYQVPKAADPHLLSFLSRTIMVWHSSMDLVLNTLIDI